MTIKTSLDQRWDVEFDSPMSKASLQATGTIGSATFTLRLDSNELNDLDTTDVSIEITGDEFDSFVKAVNKFRSMQKEIK